MRRRSLIDQATVDSKDPTNGFVYAEINSCVAARACARVCVRACVCVSLTGVQS